jgi:phosphoribosylformylglycinamidine synthase
MKKIMVKVLLKLIEKNLVLSSHDISSGGLITALSEMAINSDYGAKIQKPKRLTNYLDIFLEKIRQDI